MKFCPNCGSQVAEGVTYCGTCGTDLRSGNNANQTAQAQQYQTYDTNQQYQTYDPNQQYQSYQSYQSNQQFNGGVAGVNKRDIVMAIILSIFTCGIYGTYWFICMTDDVNKLDGDPSATSGILAFILTLVTCGIYGIYWSYKMGEKMYNAGSKHGVNIQNNSIIYLVLAFVGLQIVTYCLIQSDINKLAN